MKENETKKQAAVAADYAMIRGGALKALGDMRVGGWLVKYSDADSPDLTGDFFDATTNFGSAKSSPILIEHSMDPELGDIEVGEVKHEFRDLGVWVEGKIQARKEYKDFLDRTYGPQGASRFEKAVYDLVATDQVDWSSGVPVHRVRREPVLDAHGSVKAYHIKKWPLGLDASLTVQPAEPTATAKAIKNIILQSPPGSNAEQAATNDAAKSVEGEGVDVDKNTQTTKSETKETMENQVNETPAEQEVKSAPVAAPAAAPAVDTQKIVADAVAEAMKAFQASTNATSKEVKFQGSAPAVHTNTNTHKFDRYSVEDLALTASVLKSAAHLPNARQASSDLYASLAARLEGSEGSNDAMRVAQAELKSWMYRTGVKANEIHQSTLASGGDEWVGVAYSSDIWNVVRQEAMIVGMLPQFEFPAGSESMIIPLESTDPTWYTVPQSSALSANPGGIPTNTVTSSKLTTANKSMTLAKIGARSLWSGEVSEDAVLPFANQLRNQFAVSGAEHLESAFLDGDTAAGASANINDIAGTPAATDYFINFDGPRKLALVTNTANSRDAGVLTSEDFLETAKLMGTNGRNAIDKTKVKFIIDNSTHYKALQLADVKTRDVNSAATVESGNLVRAYGYDVLVSGHMCKAGSGLSNTAGKIDVDTPANNTKGQILAIRPDQWRFGYRRNMTLESTRVPAADATEIVALMRFSYGYRDNEAAAISYNVTV